METEPGLRMEPPRLERLNRRLRLARQVLRAHWFQPATALWRVFEAEVVVAHLQANGRGLDLGCGDGTLAPVLFSGLNGSVCWTGLDIDPGEVGMARRNGAHRFLIAASAAAIPTLEDSFDVVFSNSALEHMPRLEEAVAQAARTMRTGGRFVFTVPTSEFHRHLLWPCGFRTLGLRETARRYERHLDRRIHHVNYLSALEWRELLAKHGLTIVREESYLSRRACFWWESLANLTGGLLYLLRRGRKSPREVQRGLGLGGTRNRFMGNLMFVILYPLLVWLSAERPSHRGAALYIEAVKPGAQQTTGP